MLSFERIRKEYADGTQALRGIDLSVPRGQFCVILGPSGAGKSTLLRMVNGLAAPSSGRVAVDGVEVTERSLVHIRPRVAMVHQQFNLVPRASVAANVLAGGLPAISTVRALLHLYPPGLRAKCCELLDQVGLSPEHLHRRVSDLSGGQQQRVGIARAFMLDPEIVLADEPVASLDPKISRDILDLIRQEARMRNATVLCSLHQLALAKDFADRIVALKDGLVVYDGPPAGLDRAVGDIYGTLLDDDDVPSSLCA